MLSNHLMPCCALLHLPSIFPHITIFFNELAFCIRWPMYWSFSFSISPFNEYSGLIFFRIDWFDLFSVQGTLKSLPQHHNSKASILRHLAFFTVQLSHPYMTTEKNVALTIWTFVSKVISLLFNMLSRFAMRGFPDSLVGKESACNAGDPGLIPRLGRSAGEGISYPLQYSGLQNSMDCIVHGVTKSRT